MARRTDRRQMATTIARKSGTTPGQVSAVFWALLDYASQHADRGSVADFDIETFAAWSGWDDADIAAIIDAMQQKGVITADERLSAWDKRQPKREDDSAERVRRHRERALHTTENDTVTHRNADVTQSNAPDKIRSEEIRSERQNYYLLTKIVVAKNCPHLPKRKSANGSAGILLEPSARLSAGTTAPSPKRSRGK